MTKRDFLEKVMKGQVTEEMQEYAKAQVKKLDEVNAKRAEKKGAEHTAVDNAVLSKTTAEPQKAVTVKDLLNAELAEGQKPYSLSLVTASYKRLIAKGKVVKTEGRENSRIYGLYALAE